MRRAPEELLAREYELFKPEVLRTVAGKLAASGARVPDADLDAVYNDAWHGLYIKLTAGESVENRKGLLVTIAHRRALNEHRALRPGRRANPDELSAVGVEPEIEERLDDQAKLRQLVEGLRERLDGRQQQAAALCYLYDYSRPEAAQTIGVTPKRMEKIMDGVSKQVRELVGEIQAGTRCSGYESLLRAYAVGLLEEDGERYRLARDHLDSCSACRRNVLLLRGIAAVTPPVPILLGTVGAAGSSPPPAGAEGGSSAGMARGARRASRLKRGTVATGAAAVAAAAVAIAVVAVTDGDGDAPTPSPSASATTSAPPVSSPAPAPERSRAAGRKRHAARAHQQARRRRAQAQVTPAGNSEPTPAQRPPRPAPAPTTPDTAVAAPNPQPPAAQAPPIGKPSPKPPPPPAPRAAEPVRDGAEEFELR